MAEIVAKYKIEVDDAVRNLNKLEGEVKDVDKSLDKAGKDGAKSIDKVGVSAKTTESSFSKMKIAVVAAFSVMATAAIAFGREAVNLAAKAEGITTAFNKLNNPNLLNDLRIATRGTVTDVKLMQAAIRAKNFQVPLEKLASFFEFATKRSIETGESVDYLVNSIVDGIGRKSTLVLDNLGISATELQAEINKTGDFGLAAANIISRGLAETGDVADTTAIQIARLNTQWENFKTRSGGVISGVILDFADSLGFINKNQGAIDGFKKSLDGLNATQLADKLKDTLREVESVKRRQLQLSSLENKLAKEAGALEGEKLKSNRELRDQVFREQEATRNGMINQNDFIIALKEELRLRGQISEEVSGVVEFYTPDQIEAIIKAGELTKDQVRNVFFLQKAIKELTDTQKEQGTSVERVKQITDELIPLQDELNALLGKETEAMKAAREEREKAIKAIEDEAKELRKLLKAKIDAMHDSEEKAMAEALESIEFRFALEKLYTTQSISEAEGRSDALLQIEHDRLEAILKARREFGMETIEQEQALADLQAGILDGQNKSGDGAGISSGEVNGNKWWFDGMSDAQLGEFEDSLAITEQYVGAISGLFSNLAALQSQLAQEELKNLDEQLEAGAISREEYDIRRRQILTQQAEDQKAFAVFDSAINGALAIVNAFAEGGPILAAIVGLGVAAQIAAIVAAPIPQFAQGVIGLKGKGTETSDEIPAMLSLNESVMTAAETRKYNAELWAMRNGTFDKLMKEKYSVPKIDASLFSGWGDMGKSAKLNGLMATLKDHNIIAALDRSRQSQTNGFKYLAKELKQGNRRKRGGYDSI